jgi:hypothetical protein
MKTPVMLPAADEEFRDYIRRLDAGLIKDPPMIKLGPGDLEFRAYVRRLDAGKPKWKPPTPTAEPFAWTPELEERSRALAKVIAAKLRGEL